MDVSPGYKQTEVGVIPEDWGVSQIGTLQPFVTSGSRGWARFYSDRGAPFIRITNLSRGCIYLELEDLRFVNLAGNDSEASRTQLQDGDVLISITAEIGIVGHVSKRLPKPAYINQHIALVRFDSALVSSKFVSYFLASEKPQRFFRALTDSGAKAGMNLTTLQQIRLSLPPTKAEQEAIAEALSDADALIESVEQLLAKKRQIKQGAMQELLTGKRRLPGFEIKPGHRQTEVGVIPEDWAVSTVGTEFSIQLGKMLDAEKNVGVRKPFLGNRAVQWGRIDLTDIGEIKLTPSDLHRFRLRDGDLLVCEGGEIGRAAIWRKPLEECYYQKALHRLRPIRGYDVQLMLNVLQRLVSTGFLLNFVTQTSIAHLPKDKFETVLIPLPPTKAEQKALATILSDMDAEIDALEARLTKARQIKQGMMQELLTGRIRLVRPASTAIQPPAKKEPVSISAKAHNWQINEAVVISVLAKHFGSEQWPLGRKRYTKLSYLLHRHAERQAEGYLKKAAGPYNPATKYRGPEAIALKNRYIRRHSRGKLSGFVAAESIDKADNYFSKWYGDDALAWLEQFRHTRNDDLEILTTVDMAMEDLRREGTAVQLETVKQIIQGHPEWQAKLDRPTFSDANIFRAIEECRRLFQLPESDG